MDRKLGQTKSGGKLGPFRRLKDENKRLRSALAQLVIDWEKVPDDVQVPDEINVDEHWQAARDALGLSSQVSNA